MENDFKDYMVSVIVPIKVQICVYSDSTTDARRRANKTIVSIMKELDIKSVDDYNGEFLLRCDIIKNPKVKDYSVNEVKYKLNN